MPSTEDRTELLTRMLRPRGVAVIGASEQQYSLGSRYLGGLVRHQYPGGLYPVNPKYDEVMGLKCYASIGDVVIVSIREAIPGAKVKKGEKLSPVLLVQGTPLWVADGYHRICTSYHLDEKEPVPCRIAPRAARG